MNVANHFDLTFALKNDEVVSIDEVDSGLACRCICPACGVPLIAKKGQYNQHHFAHYNADSCGKGMETIIHRLAKKVIVENMLLLLPGDEKLTRLSYAQPEYRRQGYVSDVSTAIEGTGELVEVEIFVTHSVDEDKLEKVRAEGVKMMEIDLSPLLNGFDTRKELESFVIALAKREWLCEGDKPVEEDSVEDSLGCYISSWVATGYKYVTGYSNKNKQGFSYAVLNVLEEIKGLSSRNYNVHAVGGYEVRNLRIDPSKDLLEKLGKLTFPTRLDIRSESKPTERGIEHCVVDVMKCSGLPDF